MSKGWEGMEKLIQIPEQAGEGSNLGSQMWLYRDDRSHKWSVTARRKMSMSSGKQGKKPWHKDDQNVKTCWFFATLWRKLNSYHFMLTAIFTDFHLSSENILQKRAGWLSLTSQCLYWRLFYSSDSYPIVFEVVDWCQSICSGTFYFPSSSCVVTHSETNKGRSSQFHKMFSYSISHTCPG